MWKWHDVSLGEEVMESCFSLFYYESLVTCFPVWSKSFGLSAVFCSYYSWIGLLNLVCKSNFYKVVFNFGWGKKASRSCVTFSRRPPVNIVMSSLWVCCVCVEELRGVQENDSKIQFGFYRSFFSSLSHLKCLKCKSHVQRLTGMFTSNVFHRDLIILDIDLVILIIS